MKRPRVLLLAYMISPSRGSEYAVAWNHVEAMRTHCDLTVLYGAAGPHMGDVDDFAEPDFESVQPDSIVRFRFVAPPPQARRLNALNRRGIFSYSFYLAYRAWHRAALARARELMATEQFDLVHYVGPIGYREPGYLWRLPLPYVWGPIGGATSFPWNFRSTMPIKSRLGLMTRTIGNIVQLRFGRRIDRALQRADFLLTATTENQQIFLEKKGIQSKYLAENGIEGDFSLNTAKFSDETIRIIWIGSIEARKGLTLLLHALARLRKAMPIIVDVVGDGPLRAQLQQEAKDLGVDHHLVWHGKIPRPEVLALLDKSHLHVVTGLNEGNPTSVWEALGRSVPVLALDHCGMHDVVQPPYGLRVPVTSIEVTVQGLADALNGLIAAPERLEEMARSCAQACEHYRIAHRPAVFMEAYRTAMARFRKQEA